MIKRANTFLPFHSATASDSETMRVVIILLFACLALVALADDNAAQLEETDEDSPMSLSDASDEVSGRSKREENPLLAVHHRARRGANRCYKSVYVYQNEDSSVSLSEADEQVSGMCS
ncbi:hypothetical protein LSAT2_022650 [Lamellibrachia satsuma]|nr:hypothetical protein LSAT2_022650 [Lamellibrachia satsuma]